MQALHSMRSLPSEALEVSNQAAPRWRGKLDSFREQFAHSHFSADEVDESQMDWSYSRKFAAHLILNPKFDGFVATIVVVNSIMMGLESEIKDQQTLFLVTDMVFLVIYSVEIVVRLHVMRKKLFHHIANVLDVVIVVGGWASAITEIWGTNVEQFRLITTLKVLRAFRSIRLLRMFTFFEGCWIIAASFSSCLVPLIWTCVFLVIILFTFTMFAVELIGNNDAFKGLEQKDLFYPSHIAFFTLFQVTTLDEWRDIVQPLCDKQWWAYLFFLLYICVTSMSLMNLVTAVVVDSSLKRTLNEADYKRIREQRERLVECASIEEYMNEIENAGKASSADDGNRGSTRVTEKRCSGADPGVQRTTQGTTMLSPEQSAKQILQAKKSWKGVEKIFDAFGIEREEDVEKVMRYLDENGDGMLSTTELLDGLLDLRQITEDKYRVALIQACNTQESRCSTVERCVQQLRAPEDCVYSLRALSEELEKASEKFSGASLSECIDMEVRKLQEEMQEQRWKLALQRQSLEDLRDAVRQLQASQTKALANRRMTRKVPPHMRKSMLQMDLRGPPAEAGGVRDAWPQAPEEPAAEVLPEAWSTGADQDAAEELLSE